MRLTDSAHSCVWLVSWERDVTKKSRMSCTRFIYDIIYYMSYLSRDTIHITFDWSIVVKDYVTHETGGRPVTFCFCRVVAF